MFNGYNSLNRSIQQLEIIMIDCNFCNHIVNTYYLNKKIKLNVYKSILGQPDKKPDLTPIKECPLPNMPILPPLKE